MKERCEHEYRVWGTRLDEQINVPVYPPFEHLYNKQEVIKEFDGHKVIKYSK